MDETRASAGRGERRGDGDRRRIHDAARPGSRSAPGRRRPHRRCVVAEGHVLLKDLPGVGKTTLARSVARSSTSSSRASSAPRTSCPPTSSGSTSSTSARTASSSAPGRSSRTSCSSTRSTRVAQDAVRPARVHAGAERHRRRLHAELARPFLVLATQNPVEFEGTYPLPEAQVDRFMVPRVARLPGARGRADELPRPRDGRPRRGDRTGGRPPPRC